MNTKKSPVGGFLRGVLRLLIDNWGLKLLALLLAFILYHSLKNDDGYYHAENDRQLFQYR